MTYNADELGAPKQYSVCSMQHRRGKNDQQDYFNRDIAKQVHHWMKNRPDGFMCSLTPRTTYAQAVMSREKEKRRRKKRYKLAEAEDMDISFDSSTNADSEISTGFDTALKRRYGQGKAGSRASFKTIGHAFSCEDIRRPQEGHGQKHDKDGKDKRSVFGSVHNEIEFQKRYRRMFDLNKHLQFVNSTNGLKGQRIAKKNNRLPPMDRKRIQGLECSELFAIQSVQKTNEPIDIDKPIDRRHASLENLSFGHEIDIDTAFVNSGFKSRTPTLPKASISKFDKLPKITPRGETGKKAGVITSNGKCNLEKADTNISDDNGHTQIQEMKVTINIKYKSENCVTPRFGKSSTPRAQLKQFSEYDDYKSTTPFDKVSFRLNSKTPASGTISNMTNHLSEEEEVEEEEEEEEESNFTPSDKHKYSVHSSTPDTKMSRERHFVSE